MQHTAVHFLNKTGVCVCVTSQIHAQHKHCKNTWNTAEISYQKARRLWTHILECLSLHAYKQILTFLNWRNRLMRAPLPNGWVRLAWNAMVGYSDDNVATHFCCWSSLNNSFHNKYVIREKIEYKSCKTCAFQNIRVKVLWGMRFPKQLKVQTGQSYDASKLDKTKEGGRKKEVLVSDRWGKCSNFAPTSASQCQSILKSQIYLQ